jgi:hypothetical protein
MKKTLLLIAVLLSISVSLTAQIITPIIKANFGVDADLRCNFFNGLQQSGNDDWFRLPSSIGSGTFVIDTTGAGALINRYNTIPDSRKLPFFKQMRVPPYSVINNRLLIDAYFVRDYHGDDSTIFANGSNKNGMSPADWTCPVSQSVPDKNEILDAMVHVRRAGPTTDDSMWLFGGISIENTTGNRYFDFEMYQTNIYYDRATRRFYNYGPDAGHTSWKFDAAGNMTQPGDIILTAEYSSSSLTMVQARVWIDRADLAITPAAFDWTGNFDGASNSSQFGYAEIKPKATGAYYTGLQSVNNTWAGPFALILGDNNIYTNYTARQYMEFSVNMTKLGLDQAKLFGGDDCDMPFRRILVKTRASTSFTAELKDFIAPFDFFIAPAANIDTDFPIICETGSISSIYVTNPIPTSIYQWSTTDGNILGPTTGPAIVIDRPGTYIVRQFLQAACDMYASDTITIDGFEDCGVLNNNKVELNSNYNNHIQLDWKVQANQHIKNFTIERSIDGISFTAIGQVDATKQLAGNAFYSYTDDVSLLNSKSVYYRIKVEQYAGKPLISNTTVQQLIKTNTNDLRIVPNPVRDRMQLQFNAISDGDAIVYIYNAMGQVAYSGQLLIQKGSNTIELSAATKLMEGMYQVVVKKNEELYRQKIVVIR